MEGVDLRPEPALDIAQAERAAQTYFAFCLADRICRQTEVPDARDLILRSTCLRAMGDADGAADDLSRAAAQGGADSGVQWALFQFSSEPEMRKAAGRALLASGSTGCSKRLAAVRYLLESQALVFQATRDRTGLRGWLAWRVGDAPSLWLDGERQTVHVPLCGATAAEADRTPIAGATFVVKCSDEEAVRLSVVRSDIVVDSLTLAPVRSTLGEPDAIDAGVVSVVVPIFGGFDATRACLEALADQTCALNIDVVIVDDACPDPELSRFAEQTCRRYGWTHVAHRINAGFAASTNRGLARARGEHVLMLNADAVLPPGALDRMLSAAAHPNVATVVPFSNDGGFTSFPLMRMSNRVPTPGQARDLDDAARRVNSGQVCDVPSGTAFCMLVTRACLDRVGHLDHRYGRGYFEDVDLCLRAKQAGLRNILAADIYVAHVGGQSFGREKRALAARNALVIRERFPDYDVNWASFVQADPLAAARCAIERDVGCPGPVHLLVGRPERLGSVLKGRAAECESAGARVLELRWRRDGAVLLRAADGDMPQNIMFGPTEQAAYRRYLGRLAPTSIEIAEPDAIPPAVLSPLMATQAPLAVYVADLAAARAVRDRRANWLHDVRVIPADALSRAYLQHAPVVERPGSRRSSTALGDGSQHRGSMQKASRPIIGVLLPEADIGAIHLLCGLASGLLGKRPVALVVLGASLGDIEIGAKPRVVITGPMMPSEYPAAVRHHGITHLMLPYRDRLFRVLEDLRCERDLPAIYFDWSETRSGVQPQDLVLPAGIDDGEAVELVASWCTLPDGAAAMSGTA